jgi:uncharacterized protein YecE (DUF72 family)
MPVIRLGCQGWNYPAWTGGFYPDGTRAIDFLPTYARAFDTVEVDSTFYAIPPVKTVRGWADRTPADFVFALKLPQEITHERRFIGVREVAEQFFDVARELGPKLGQVLIQCGPDLSPDEAGPVEEFLAGLPSDIAFAIEFRQREWITAEVHMMLAAHRVALALIDGRWLPRKWMLELCARPTAGHAYVRWMGPDRSLTDFSRIQVDRTAELELWAKALRTLATQVKVHGYMHNYFAGHSPGSTRMLQEMLGQRPMDPRDLREQLGLFPA